MLKLVGTHRDGSVADELVLLRDDDKPTKVLLGLVALELAFDTALACLLAKTVFKKR